MKWKKWVALLLTVGMTVSIAAGCGNAASSGASSSGEASADANTQEGGASDEGSPEENSAKESDTSEGGAADAWKDQEISLKIIHTHSDEAAQTILSSAAFDYAKKQFLADYPNVTFDETVIADSDYEALMLQYAAADDLPDLFWWNIGKSDTFIGGELVHDITDYVEPEKYLDNLESATVNGRIWGIDNKCSDNNVVYYNEKMLEEATGSTEFPKTLEELLALDEYFDAKGIDLISLGNKGQWFASNHFATALFHELCGTEWVEKFINGQADMSDPNFAVACDWIQKIGATCNPDFNAQDDAWAIAWYAQGNSFCHVSGSWIPTTLVGYKEDYPEVIENTKCAVFPSVSGAQEDTYLVSGMTNTWSIGSKVEKDSPEFYACLEFLSHYVCGEVYATYMAENGSTAPMAAEGVDFTTMDPIIQSFMEVHNYGYKTVPPLGTWVVASVNSVLISDLQSLMAGTINAEQIAADLQLAEDNL